MGGSHCEGQRQFVNGMSWGPHSGAHRKHLPVEHGNMEEHTYKRFMRRAKTGI